MFSLPTWTIVAALIAEHPGLQAALGDTPSVWAMYRFARKLRENRPALEACLDACAASLREQHPDFGRDVAIDASDLPAFANGQRYFSQGGKGTRAVQRSRRELGPPLCRLDPKRWRLLRVQTATRRLQATGLPLAWRVETARHHESKFVAPLLDALHARGFRPEKCAMDKGYDAARVYAKCEQRDCEPVIPLNGAKANQPALPLALGGRLFPRIPRHSQRFRDLYRGRAAVERAFADLKNPYGLPRFACVA